MQGLANYGCGPNLAHRLILQIKVYWNIAMAIHLCIVWGFFHALLAELNSCYKEHLVHKAEQIYHTTLYTKSLQTPGQAQWGGVEI